MARYAKARIMMSAELGGTTGDNGEQFCVFVRDISSPINSGWAWANTFADAQKLAADLDVKYGNTKETR